MDKIEIPHPIDTATLHKTLADEGLSVITVRAQHAKLGGKAFCAVVVIKNDSDKTAAKAVIAAAPIPPDVAEQPSAIVSKAVAEMIQ